MPSSVPLLAGLVLLAAGVLLLREWWRLRGRLEHARRALHRSRAAVRETARVKHARDEVLGTGDAEGTDPIRRGYDVIAGVPMALIAATPMPKEAVRLIRDAHGVVAHGVYSTIWGIDRTVGLGIIDTLTGKRGQEQRRPE